jgi:hypothetical protein
MMNYIVTVAHKDNLKEPVHYVTWAENFSQANGMMDAARSMLAFCHKQGLLSDYIIVVHDNTETPTRYFIHVETHEMGGALEYIEP